ncbi:MAG: hypothetical protein WCK67_09080 [bacterium]
MKKILLGTLLLILLSFSMQMTALSLEIQRAFIYNNIRIENLNNFINNFITENPTYTLIKDNNNEDIFIIKSLKDDKNALIFKLTPYGNNIYFYGFEKMNISGGITYPLNRYLKKYNIIYNEYTAPGDPTLFGEIELSFKSKKIIERMKPSLLQSAKKYPIISYKFINQIKVNPTNDYILNFSDDKIEIKGEVEEDRISFELKNKTEFPLTINWNDLSIVDIAGVANNVVHSGIKDLSTRYLQNYTTVPPLSRILDSVAPADNVYYANNIGWKIKPIEFLFPSTIYNKNQGSLFFPIEMNGVKHNYNFILKAENNNL